MQLGSFSFTLTTNYKLENSMRVLLADKQPKVRFALHTLLKQQPDVTVLGEALDTASLLDQVERCRPDLVLLDWSLPGHNAAEFLVRLRRNHPNLCVIVMSGRPESGRIALAAGADAFVSKADPPDRLLDAINNCPQKTPPTYEAERCKEIPNA